MILLCPALVGGQFLPARCMNRTVVGGQNVSPPLLWGDVPRGAASFVLRVTDLDEAGEAGTLWFVANIPSILRGMPERVSGDRERLPAGCLELRNGQGELRYDGPRVDRSSAPHRVAFQLWALSVPSLAIGPFAPAAARQLAVENAAIATATLTVMASRSV